MPELECRCKHVLSTSELRNYGGMLGFFALFACCDLGLSDGKRNCTAGLIKETKPRHGGFTYAGSEDDRGPMHQDGGKSSSVLSRPMLLTPRSPSRRWIVTFRLHIGTRLVDAHDERRTAPPDLRLGSAFLDSLYEDAFLPLWW